MSETPKDILHAYLQALPQVDVEISWIVYSLFHYTLSAERSAMHIGDVVLSTTFNPSSRQEAKEK